MRSFQKTFALLGLPSLLYSVTALQVAPGSPCATLCLASPADNPWNQSASATNTSDIVCSDAAFSNTETGLRFKRCANCLSTSTRHGLDETDAKWLIYNLRYAIDVCLFSTPDASPDGVKSHCYSNKSCQNLKSALSTDKLVANQVTTWDYCSADDGAFMGSDRIPCMQCLRDTQDQTYLANFLVALEAGCRQTPEAGTALGLSGTVFTSNPVNITDPTNNHSGDSNGPKLGPGAIAGIAVGVGVLLTIAIGLLVIHCQREKVLLEDSAWEYDYGYSGARTNDRFYPSQHSSVTQRGRVQYIRNTAGKSPPTKGSSGEYYDNMQTELDSNHHRDYQMEKMDHLDVSKSTSTLPFHPAYDPCAVSRNSFRDRGRTLSSPASVNRQARLHTPDSFVTQAYFSAAEAAAQHATHNAAPSQAGGTGQSSVAQKQSSIKALLSLPKIRLPKLSVPSMTTPHNADVFDPKNPNGDSRISGPIMDTNNSRLGKRPTEAPALFTAEQQYKTLRSKKTSLYG